MSAMSVKNKTQVFGGVYEELGFFGALLQFFWRTVQYSDVIRVRGDTRLTRFHCVKHLMNNW